MIRPLKYISTLD